MMVDGPVQHAYVSQLSFLKMYLDYISISFILSTNSIPFSVIDKKS